jgi:hypothetical protein
MKSELRLVPHAVLPNKSVIEVWYDGKFVATVTGLDGPGIRFISKHIYAGNFHIHPELNDASGVGFIVIILKEI